MRCVFFFNQEISFLRSSFVNYQQAVHNAALQDSKNRTHHFHWYFNWYCKKNVSNRIFNTFFKTLLCAGIY